MEPAHLCYAQTCDKSFDKPLSLLLNNTRTFQKISLIPYLSNYNKKSPQTALLYISQKKNKQVHDYLWQVLSSMGSLCAACLCCDITRQIFSMKSKQYVIYIKQVENQLIPNFLKSFYLNVQLEIWYIVMIQLNLHMWSPLLSSHLY